MSVFSSYLLVLFLHTANRNTRESNGRRWVKSFTVLFILVMGKYTISDSDSVRSFQWKEYRKRKSVHKRDKRYIDCMW